MLQNFNQIKVENLSDKIIKQIRSLITSGELKPGDKLPPERKLADAFGVGRISVRDAIKKLEFYGIVKTLPQSGTFVSGLGIAALEGLITDVLSIEESDFQSLVETRVLLEIEAAKKAAERRTEEDLAEIKIALEAYEEKLNNGELAIEEDLLFHLKIAEASKNSVLNSLMLVITPDIIKNFVELKVCNKETNQKTIEEHRLIMKHIINRDVEGVQKAMSHHLRDILQFSNKSS
jgi:GntR family transcriptional repressor for pyruvate dehydrogenase complex